jgi:hypothetical protein
MLRDKPVNDYVLDKIKQYMYDEIRSMGLDIITGFLPSKNSRRQVWRAGVNRSIPIVRMPWVRCA